MADFNRVIVKLSGEALAGDKGHGFDDEILTDVATNIKAIHDKGVDVGIVVGGGNFWRGRGTTEMDRSTSDYIGMLGTTMNALRLEQELVNLGVDVKVLSSINMDSIAEKYNNKDADKYLKEGKVLIFSGGTGLPFFSTDTTSALRACELGITNILVGKNGTDGVYDKDPNKYSDAKKFDNLTYDEIFELDLKVIDQTAASLCKENNISLIVFGIEQPENLVKIINGENIGTIIRGE